jgi:REP element-mobilizing transposase RayT
MTKFDPKIHHRRSIRLQGYDYSQAGAYFVTIVTYQRDCIFGKIENGETKLNDLGRIADECWRAIPEHFPFVELGAHIIMPNHVHGIIVITDDGRGAIYRAPTESAPTIEQFGKPTIGSLPTIIRTYKAAVTRIIGREHNATGIWQRNYHEHIIRNEREMDNIWRYIESNPAHWDDDEENLFLASTNSA